MYLQSVGSMFNSQSFKNNYTVRVIAFFVLTLAVLQFLWHRSFIVQSHSISYSSDALSLLKAGLYSMIPLGLDYLVLAICMYLLIPSWEQMSAAAFRFALAQTVAVVLASSKILVLNNYVVETMLGIGILYLAFENLYIAKYKGQRIGISFGLGLVYGLHLYHKLVGSGLSENVGMPDIMLVNVGVIAGQLLILVMVYQFIGRMLAGNAMNFRWFVLVPFSVLTLIAAGYWTVHQIIY